MLGFLFFFIGKGYADVGAQLSLEMTSTGGRFDSVLTPGIQNHVKLYMPISNIQVGMAFGSSHHNGVHYMEQAEFNCEQDQICMQGDSWIGSFGLYSGYNIKTTVANLNPYAGVYVHTIPLLIDEKAYQEEVLEEWGGFEPELHQGIKPSLRLGLDIRFPFWENGPGFLLTGGADYLLDVGLFTHFGLGLYID